MTGLIKVGLGLVAVVAPAVVFFQRADRQIFLPGHTSPGHHQIEKKCEACHTPLGGVLQKACVDCHGEGLSAEDDSHSTGKFEDPRNALQLGRLDASHCVECHREHRPEETDRMSVSARPGFCVECHRDVARERPDHASLAFTTCTDTGCHNFHDNRAVYGDFLKKHRDEPDLLPKPVVVTLHPEAARPGEDPPGAGAAPAGTPAAGTSPAGAPAAAEGPAGPVAAGHPAPPAPPAPPPVADAPSLLNAGESSSGSPIATASWARSAHARAGVNCSGCHRDGGKLGSAWNWRPDPTATCARCHGDERRTFLGGKHGMRLAVGLPPMVPADALLPMKTVAKNDPHERGLTCSRCHDVHDPDLRIAAVETCEGCHDDGHTRAYRKSPHFARWQEELAGAGKPGSGVSCATCHLPRTVDRTGSEPRTWVDHNQNANLRPVDKMARSVCVSCHGLAFSLASLADRAVVEGNFAARPRPARTGFDLLPRKTP